MNRIDPSHCFPLVVDREGYEGGNSKMIILRGQYRDGTISGETNVCARSGTPIAVLVSDVYRPFLRRYLLNQGLYEDEVTSELEHADQWYGIVDGNIRLWAILQL